MLKVCSLRVFTLDKKRKKRFGPYYLDVPQHADVKTSEPLPGGLLVSLIKDICMTAYE